jgi:hypothetical protein
MQFHHQGEVHCLLGDAAKNRNQSFERRKLKKKKSAIYRNQFHGHAEIQVDHVRQLTYKTAIIGSLQKEKRFVPATVGRTNLKLERNTNKT